MHFEVFSLFPQYIQEPLRQSILKRAIDSGQIKVTCEDIRTYSTGQHKRVDDSPYGGGPGMLLMADPIVKGIEEKKEPNSKVIYLSPQGRRLTPRFAKELAQESHVILLAGHYEGVDIRAIESVVDMELSIGDFVLTNGCLAALLVIDVVARYIPGVLGDTRAAEQDSFESHLLDFPHYTRPEIYNSVPVPKVLLSGNHAHIESWRYGKSLEATWTKRPDLFSQAVLAKNGINPSTTPAPILREISIPTTFFSISLQFYSQLFQKEPTLEIEGALQRATWSFEHSAFSLTLYSTPFEKNVMPVGVVFEYALEERDCIDFLIWIFRKMARFSPFLETEKITKDSIVTHIQEKRSITLLDPSGYRISLHVYNSTRE